MRRHDNTSGTMILLAGAGGKLGRLVAAELAARGHRVRALVRREPVGGIAGADTIVRANLTDPATLHGICRDVEVVVSCAGASMDINAFGERGSFDAVDHRGNRALLDEALRAGVRRFVYVSLFGADRLARTEYAAAHERFVAALERSGVDHCVVRPTGFFWFNGEILRMARKGRGFVIGSGEARTNPIHEGDVARLCADAAEGSQRVIEAGGPKVYTRRQIVELALATVTKKGQVMRMPGWFFYGASGIVSAVNGRIGSLLRFGTAVSQTDIVAPAVGRLRLEEYFRELAGKR